jgi:hypothetical protein
MQSSFPGKVHKLEARMSYRHAPSIREGEEAVRWQEDVEETSRKVNDQLVLTILSNLVLHLEGGTYNVVRGPKSEPGAVEAPFGITTE